MTDIIFYGRTLGTIELTDNLEDNVMAAAKVVESMMNASWPEEFADNVDAPQPRLLACGRVLSAIVRGCDSSKENVFYFRPRDVVLEDRIVTLFLRAGGIRIIARMNDQWRGSRKRRGT